VGGRSRPPTTTTLPTFPTPYHTHALHAPLPCVLPTVTQLQGIRSDRDLYHEPGFRLLPLPRWFPYYRTPHLRTRTLLHTTHGRQAFHRHDCVKQHHHRMSLYLPRTRYRAARTAAVACSLQQPPVPCRTHLPAAHLLRAPLHWTHLWTLQPRHGKYQQVLAPLTDIARAAAEINRLFPHTTAPTFYHHYTPHTPHHPHAPRAPHYTYLVGTLPYECQNVGFKH